MYTLLGKPLEAGNWKSRGMIGFGLARMFLDGAFITWLAVWERLSTRDRLLKWEVVYSTQWVLCGSGRRHIPFCFLTLPTLLRCGMHLGWSSKERLWLKEYFI